MQGIDHDAFKKQCEGDLFLFTKCFVSDWVDPNLHYPITEHYKEGIDAGEFLRELGSRE